MGFPRDRLNKIKRFVKSHHEIRYNLQLSKYIPNFDNYDLGQKVEVVAALTGNAVEAVMAWDVESIELRFARLIAQEVQELEADVGHQS